jgi:PAS domain S-box-containing protein
LRFKYEGGLLDLKNSSEGDSADIVLVMDGRGLVVEWTREAEAIFGWTAADAIGQKLSALVIPHQHRAAHEAGLRRFLGGGPGSLLDRPIEIVAIDSSGHEFNVALRITPEKTAIGYRFATTARKIS